RTHALLTESRVPELLEADLAPLTLELAQWGAPEPAALAWLDIPPAPRIEAARTLLRGLDALDDASRVTPVGTRLLDFPTHPRLAHLLAAGHAAGQGALAADVAALLEERDPLGAGHGSDLTERVAALRVWRRREDTRADVAVLERAERLSRQWRQRLDVGCDDREPAAFDVGDLIALAYPERIALARGAQPGRPLGRFLMAGGMGATVPEGDALAGAPALAVAHLDAWQADARVYLAAPIDLGALTARGVWTDAVRWDGRTGTLVAQQECRLGALVLGTRPLGTVPTGERVAALADAIRAEGLHLLTFPADVMQLRARLGSLRSWHPDEAWPDVSDAALLATLGDWLGPALGSARTRDDLSRVNLRTGLTALVPWNLTRELDDRAPTHLTVPTGSRVRVEYRADGEAPILAVKLQELFGLADTPAVDHGRRPVLLHLLSPAGRPVQVTQDLRSFWNSSYFEVRKDLRGRYPKHPWPDDPWSHRPMKGVTRRGV
uniref:ATP-dependent helicase C-terminal domain-containing protein n=1 Tax=Deinococcus sp. TaxID=47478 RepID=UPI002869D9D5